MTDHVLLTTLFNYICGSGGFVEFGVLLKPSSPFRSKRSKMEVKKWLESQGSDAGFVCVKEQNGEIAGVRVDLRKNICYQYSLAEGNCRSRRQGNCKYWHICKSYVEGKCEGICGLSHDFHSEDNKEIAEELGLEKYSNETVRNIVGWSLPRVCQSYLRNECELSECPYLHICAQFVEGSSCKCSMSHNLTDSHNNIILEQYDLVLPNQVTNVDFVRCSVLVLDEQRAIGTGKSVESSGTVTQKTTSAAVTNNKGDTSLFGNTAEANPAIKQNPLSANVCPVTSPAKIKEQENA